MKLAAGKCHQPEVKRQRLSPSPKAKTPIRLKVERIERKVRMKASTPQRKRKVIKELDLDLKQRKIGEFFLKKSQHKAEITLETSQETGGLEETTQRATCGPLLGLTGCRAPQTPS